MYLKIHNIEKIPNGSSFNLLIKGVTLYDKNKYIKGFKLDDNLIEIIKEGKIIINPNLVK